MKKHLVKKINKNLIRKSEPMVFKTKLLLPNPHPQLITPPQTTALEITVLSLYPAPHQSFFFFFLSLGIAGCQHFSSFPSCLLSLSFGKEHLKSGGSFPITLPHSILGTVSRGILGLKLLLTKL